MSLSREYFSYLEHFSKTVTVRELSENSHIPDLIALRHDIDYDLDLALEMSYWEREEGIRSTYYLLHTADYWQEPHFLEKCLQIQDFGHEVGLHLNVLTEWIQGKIQDVAMHLQQLITPLRQAGLNISGTSTHGDRLCYDQGFINYWCFRELKPSNLEVETGLSAEGIPVKEEKFQIQYPKSNFLERSGGERFNLWSVSMKNLGISYDAIHTSHNFYYTDSGGGWSRSADPLKCSLKSGRHQVLLHPIYWRGEKKIYFFLSTARSGSKWLTNFLEKVTPLKAQHEFTLNHRFKEGKLIADKRTADKFIELVDKQNEARDLLIEALGWIEDLTEDYAEANVYLERFSLLLEEVFPHATLIHLHRNPKDVIRSIINRDWYDTPGDNRHPLMKVSGWENLGQFEKSCWYVRQTNQSLLSLCQERLVFEQMVSDLNYLVKKLRSWNIPVFPRLAESVFEQKVNVNYNYDFPEYEQWSIQQQSLFHSICTPINIALGYKSPQQNWRSLFSYLTSWYLKLVSLLRLISRQVKKLLPLNSKQILSQIDFSKDLDNAYSIVGCQVKITDNAIEIFPENGRNSYFLIGGGQWNKLQDQDGWESRLAHYYQGSLDIDIGTKGLVRFFCLMYDQEGKLIAKRSLGQIKQDSVTFRFAFRPKSNTKRFNLAIYMTGPNLPEKIQLKQFHLEMISL